MKLRRINKINELGGREVMEFCLPPTPPLKPPIKTLLGNK